MSRRDRPLRWGPVPVVVAFVVAVLVACGNGGDEPAAGTQPGPTSIAPTTGEPTTTSEEPATTEAPPAATEPPETTEAPAATQAPDTTAPPTTEAPDTTAPPTTEAPATTAPPTTAAQDPPARPTDPEAAPEPAGVSIPAIDATSDLLHLGLRPDGTAEVPEDFDVASWYDLGGRPGGTGTPTVILGHVDSISGPAVFFRLRDLSPGDEVQVDLSDGSTATYAVTGTEEFPKDEFPTAEVFGATTDDVVRLVTCSGEFDRGERSYTDNLVVSAERIA
jgi:hypothetical protein